MNVNVKSMFHTCKAVVPHMLNGGGGSILNISSLAAVDHSSPPLFIYTISKAAVNSFTRCLAMQLAGKGIRVNAIMPGVIDTPMVYYCERLAPRYGGDLDKMREVRNESVPMKRMGEPWTSRTLPSFLSQTKPSTSQVRFLVWTGFDVGHPDQIALGRYSWKRQNIMNAV